MCLDSKLEQQSLMFGQNICFVLIQLFALIRKRGLKKMLTGQHHFCGVWYVPNFQWSNKTICFHIYQRSVLMNSSSGAELIHWHEDNYELGQSQDEGVAVKISVFLCQSLMPSRPYWMELLPKPKVSSRHRHIYRTTKCLKENYWCIKNIYITFSFFWSNC